MILANVNSSLQAILGGIPSSAWSCVVDVQDNYRIPTGTVAAFSISTPLTGIGPTTIAGPPGSTVLTRVITALAINNLSAGTLTLLLQINNNGTITIVYIASMDPGDVLTYSVAAGFVVVNKLGQIKTAAAITATATSPIAVQLSDGQAVYDLVSLAPQLRAMYRQQVVAHMLNMARTGQFVPMDPGLPF